MKRFFTIIIIGLLAGTAKGATKPIGITVYNTPMQHITGFGRCLL
jgi:hypothetical protein